MLQARDHVLEAVLEETKKHLRDISSSSDATRYESLLEQLVLQVSSNAAAYVTLFSPLMLTFYLVSLQTHG